MSAGQGIISAEELNQSNLLLSKVYAAFDQKVVGQVQLRTALLNALLSGGHILLESVPGLAKTTAAETLARSVSGSFHRIQCTPDLMPNDIVGTQIYNYGTGSFTTQLGPVHANVVLLDEINRSSAKTQSAMLEAMQEKQTSIGGKVYPLPDPFMVMATQNPIEEEGTYVLPEAQMDRFLMKEVLTYPSEEQEVEILERVCDGTQGGPFPINVITIEDVRFLRSLVDQVYVDPSIKRYIVALINATRLRNPQAANILRGQVRLGASPRGAIALMRVSQALAIQSGRAFVIPEDIKAVRYAVLRHRIARSFDALANSVPVEQLIDAIFDAVPTP